ncbi:hypothetical protein ACEPAF_4358 [Sanghuangporus sanghuang]
MSLIRSLHSPFQPSFGPASSLPATVTDAHLVQYAILAAFVLQVYDYIINFDEEVRLIWSRDTPCIRQILFFLNRYLPFVTACSSTYFLLFNKNQSYCRPAHFAIAAIALAGAVLAEWTLFLRTCAICSSKAVSFLLLLMAVVTPVGAFIDTVYYVGHSTVLGIDLPHKGCLFWYRLKIEWVSVAALIFCESVAFCLLIIKAIHLNRYSKSHIMVEICRVSILYFGCIIGSSIANLLIQLFGSSALCDILLIPQSILHQILCTHFILRLRLLSEESSVTVSHGAQPNNPVRGSWCESEITV